MWEIMSLPCRGCKSRRSFKNTPSDILPGFELFLFVFVLFFFFAYILKLFYWVSWALWSRILDSWTEGWVCFVCWQRQNTTDHQCLFRAKQLAMLKDDALIQEKRRLQKILFLKTNKGGEGESACHCFVFLSTAMILLSFRSGCLKRKSLAWGPEQSQTN